MIKEMVIFGVFFIVINLQTTSENIIPKKYIGTYIARDYITTLRITRSHIMSLNKIRKKGIYDIIAIDKDKIYSNLRFHDQYALDTEEFSHNWVDENEILISDKKGNIYQKISTNANYYLELKKFYFSYLSNSIQLTDEFGNSMEILDNGKIILNDKEYNLYLDVAFRKDKVDLIYSRNPRSVYGIRINNNYISIYRVEDIGEINFDINEKTIENQFFFITSKILMDYNFFLNNLIENIRNTSDQYYYHQLIATIVDLSNDIDLVRYFEEEQNLIRNAYYLLGDYFFDSDIDTAIEYYKKSFKYCASNRERKSSIVDTVDLSDWTDEGKNNAPCYYIAYNIACAYSLRYIRSGTQSYQNIESSFSWLRAALDMSYPHYNHLYQDEDLRVLRSDYGKRFNELINSYNAKKK